MFRDFQTKIPPDRARLARGGKTFLIVAVVAVIISVGGIFFLKTTKQPAPSPTTTAQKSISLTSPQGAEQWEVGSRQSITWDSVEVETVRISIAIGGKDLGTSQEIDASLDRHEDFVVPDMSGFGIAPPYELTILIFDAQDPNVSDKVTFTATEPLDTSTWQTYRNEEFGFEVRYPSDWIVFTRYDQYDQVIEFSPDPEKSKLSAAGNFIEVKSFSLSGSESPQEIMIENTFLGESDRNPKSFDAFEKRTFGDTSFFYIHNYLFEGQHGGIYYTVSNKQVLMFRFIAYIDMDLFTEVTEEEYFAATQKRETAIEEGPVHSTLKQILSTFRFVK